HRPAPSLLRSRRAAGDRRDVERSWGRCPAGGVALRSAWRRARRRWCYVPARPRTRSYLLPVCSSCGAVDRRHTTACATRSATTEARHAAETEAAQIEAAGECRRLLGVEALHLGQ